MLEVILLPEGFDLSQSRFIDLRYLLTDFQMVYNVLEDLEQEFIGLLLLVYRVNQ
jgi:hypothetical protein